MITRVAGPANSKTEMFFERHAWKVLLGVSLVIGIFGVGDMLGGTADLQNGETVMMHSLTGTSWNELQAASPNAANLIDMKFRTDGASLTTIALLSIAVCLTGFRQGSRLIARGAKRWRLMCRPLGRLKALVLGLESVS